MRCSAADAPRDFVRLFFRVRSCATLLTGLALTLGLSAPSEAGAEEKVVLQLKWRHAFQFAGYYAAIEQGYYREAGLEVELREGGAETNFAEELSSGSCHYSVALSSMLIHRQEGKPVVALAAILQHSPEVLLVLEKSGLNTPHQMAGKTVAVSPEDTPALLAMFKNEGLAPGAVKTIPYQFDVEAMLAGKVDGMGAYTINEPFQLQQRGVGYRLIQPRDYGVDLYGDCLFTSEAELKNHPERVQRFLNASLKGWRYAMGARQEMIGLIRGKYGSPLSEEALRYEAEQMAQLMFADLIDVGHMNEGRWRHIGDTYVRLGMMKPGYSLKGFLYDRNPPRDLTWLLSTLGAAAAGLLLLGGVVLMLVRINRRISNAERQARESQAMLETILNAIPVGVFWKDRDSRILGCNEVFARQSGIDDAKRAHGLKTASLPIPWRDASDSNTDQEVLEEGKSILHREKVTTLPGGDVRHVYQSKVPLRDGQGNIIGVVGVVEDVTTLKQAEERQAKLKDRLREAQKFESLHRMANGVCHHSNNILQAISSYAELALMMDPQSPSQPQLEGVIRESRRAAALYKMLLVSTGQGRHEFADIGLEPLLSQLLPSLKESLPANHEVQWQEGQTEAVIHADQESLKQLLMNLLMNASEAMGSEAGVITVITGQMHCDARYLEEMTPDPPPAGDYAFVEVADHGTGMTEEVRKMVFDPFFSTKFTGRGLGMAAALGIVKSHHGAMTIESVPGNGTKVRVLLPVVKA